MSAGASIPRVRIIEAEGEIARFTAAAQGYRQELLSRGLSSGNVEGVARGELLSEITLTAPPKPKLSSPLDAASPAANEPPLAYEFQELKVELGEQVQAGQTLCHLSSHQSLAIEGPRIPRRNYAAWNKASKKGGPSKSIFRKTPAPTGRPSSRRFTIRYIANTIDPVTRTFAFLMPLENQYKTVEPRRRRRNSSGDSGQGKKCCCAIRVEKIGRCLRVAGRRGGVGRRRSLRLHAERQYVRAQKRAGGLFRDRDQVVLANDGSLPTYVKDQQHWTIPAVARTGRRAAQPHGEGRAPATCPRASTSMPTAAFTKTKTKPSNRDCSCSTPSFAWLCATARSSSPRRSSCWSTAAT